MNNRKIETNKISNIEINKDSYKNLVKIFNSFAKNNIKNINFIFSDDSPELYKVIPHIGKCLKIANRRRITVNFDKYQRLIGIIFDKLFVRPEVLQIDIINKCNQSCIYCWIHSNLLRVNRTKEWYERKMDFSFFKKIIDAAKKINKGTIRICADGEPLLHPNIMQMITYVKKNSINLQIVTNGTLLSKKIIDTFLKIGVDELQITLSAATAKEYAKLHNSSEKEFKKLEKNLIYINRLKVKNKIEKPRIRLVDIVTNRNFNGIEEMIKFAIRMGSNFIGFSLLDARDEEIKKLLLAKSQIIYLDHKVKKLIQRYKNVINNNFELFRMQINQKNSANGIYSKNIYKKIGCYTPWYFWRVFVDGRFSTCCHPIIITKLGKNVDFIKIWNMSKFKEFREKMKNLNKQKEIGYWCKGCTNLNFSKNFKVHEELKRNNLLQFVNER
jgi:MoaA/NifB/PqqE/SkfB family radical SAM enzyme